jgi:hypothetical protein
MIRGRKQMVIEQMEPRTLLTSVVVNTIADSTDDTGSSTVSLRDAILIANASTTPTTITFSTTVFDTAKTITLGGTELELSNTKEATTIIGPTAGLTISGNNKSRILLVEGGVTASISNLSFTKGASARGGGIFNQGLLTATNIYMYGNVASGDGTNSDGGAISDEFSGKLLMTNSTISGNSAASSGGGVDSAGVSVTLINDTIVGNSSAGTPGGAGGGISFYYGTLLLEDDTISDNSAVRGGGIGYVTGSDGIAETANTVISDNSASSSGPDVDGTVKSSGHNLIGKTNGSTGWISSDYTGTIAKPLAADLGSLSSNGGPTETLLPLAGSPVIDKGSNSLIPSGVTTDQRGLPRIVDSTVDIGAVELQPEISLTASAGQTALAGTSKSVTLGSFTEFGGTEPYKDTITWGDGTTTTLSLTNAGTIPATAHTFAKSGTVTVTEMITDAKGVVSNVASFTDTVTAPPSSILGEVFNDGNGDGKLDGGEFGLGLWTVYIDLKDTGSFVTGDPASTTNIDGDFSFTGLAAGTYYIRVEPVTGTAATTPTVLTIKLTAGENSIGNMFGEKAIA